MFFLIAQQNVMISLTTQQIVMFFLMARQNVMISLPAQQIVIFFLTAQENVSIFLRQGLRWYHDMSPPNTRFWKWSNGVKRVEMDLFWCISMTNNVYSCKKINGRAQTFKFSVFTMGRQELLARNMEKLRKLGKLKRPFLKFFKYYDPPRVAPC